MEARLVALLTDLTPKTEMSMKRLCPSMDLFFAKPNLRTLRTSLRKHVEAERVRKAIATQKAASPVHVEASETVSSVPLRRRVEPKAMETSFLQKIPIRMKKHPHRVWTSSLKAEAAPSAPPVLLRAMPRTRMNVRAFACA